MDQHSRKLPGSIAIRLAGAQAVVLLAVVLVAVAVEVEGNRRQALANHRRWLQAVAGQGAAQLAEGAGASERESPVGWEAVSGDLSRAFAVWAWSVLRDDDVVAVALVDANHRPLMVLPTDRKLDSEALAGPGTSAAQQGVTVVQVAEGTEPLWRSYAGFGGGGRAGAELGVVVLARGGAGWEACLGGTFRFVVVLLAAAGLGLIWSVRWCSRTVDRPLRQLARVGRSRHVTATSLPKARDATMAGVMDVVEALASAAGHAESAVTQMKRSLDARVSAQVRELNVQLRRVERAAWRDPLTQLGNRRLLNERLEDILEAQLQGDGDLSVALLDLDHFKHLNDTRGHAAGDEMLRFVGELLRGSLRPTDLAVRWGGDEFVLLLPDTTPQEAAALVERLVRLFRQRARLLQLEPPVTMSAGVASLRHDRPSSGARLLDLADKALYKAKAQGKDRVYVNAADLGAQA